MFLIFNRFHIALVTMVRTINCIFYIYCGNRRYNHVNLVILHAILDSIRIRF